MDKEVLVICVVHTAWPAEGRETQSQEARAPKGLQEDVGTQHCWASRAPRLQYHHIVVFVRGRRGEGRKREGGKSWKVCWKGRRDDCLFDAGSKMAYVHYNKRNKSFSLLSFQCWEEVITLNRRQQVVTRDDPSSSYLSRSAKTHRSKTLSRWDGQQERKTPSGCGETCPPNRSQRRIRVRNISFSIFFCPYLTPLKLAL